MQSKSYALFFLSVCLAACTQQTPPPTPVTAVDPAKVQTILLARSADEQEKCEQDLAASNARVLYRNDSGLLMTDRPAGALGLTHCNATVADNTVTPLAPSASGGVARATAGPDLPTLLRLIPAEEIGARSFVAAHPDYDGRNVIVAILDTGIELDHPMLRKTSDGKNKILAFEDLSGEGRVTLQPVTVAADGTFSSVTGNYSVQGVAGAGFQFGVFAGSTLQFAQALGAQDKFVDLGVVTFRAADGTFHARVDTNNDKSFADEVELFDFSVSRAFTKIGQKRSLTVSVTVGADGSVATLSFDDGSHGTHVAGITAGFDPAGLRGVAPGAQVVLGKIGDNRLSGGSTTTASMLLAIDFAVSKKAQVINLSYGIRAGSNVGKSAIEAYVDKIAAEKGVLFSISAGNEGPGLLTVGTPAGANLAITNAAFVSKQTARDNYGYIGVQDDNTWYFSSVGPRLDGGWKPTLLAPGTALSSVPLWNGSSANYRGTSMASPHVTGGLALLLSAASQAGLATDRAAVTQAVYRSATVLPSLAWVEQGHGLMNVNKAFDSLQATKGAGTIEYKIAVNSVTTPDGKGAGIYVRARALPVELFTVGVTPQFPAGTPDAVKAQVHTFQLKATADWIHLPGSLWMNGSAKSFQVDLDPAVLASPGLHSEKISAIDEQTGVVAFEVPVTVTSPLRLNDSNGHTQSWSTPIRVGQTLRYFLDVPAGTTALTLDLSTDGPTVWTQLLDPEGRLVTTMHDTDKAPQPPMLGQATIRRAGVYELDVVAPATNRRIAQAQLKVQAYALSTTPGPFVAAKVFSALVRNDFEGTKITPKVEIRAARNRSVVEIIGNTIRIPFTITAEDAGGLSKVKFTVVTAKSFYDLMTDYPYRIFDKDGKLVGSGGLELESEIELADLGSLTPGTFQLEIQGAFTQAPPARWTLELTQDRYFTAALPVYSGSRTLVETGQTVSVPVDLSSVKGPAAAIDFVLCPMLSLRGATDRLVTETLICR